MWRRCRLRGALCAALLLLAMASPSEAAPACNCNAVPMALEPVCAGNGITVINRCAALCQGLAVARNGSCTAAPGAGAATAGAAAAALPAFLRPGQVDAAAAVGMPVMTRFRSEGYSFVARVKLDRAARARMPTRLLQGPGAATAAAAGVASPKMHATRITPTGDLYIGALTAAAPGAAAAAMGGASASVPPSPLLPSSGAPPAHRKLLQNIVGKDDRVDTDNHASPYAAVGFLASGCSGALVGPRTVLTAGHCLWDNSRGSWMSGFDFLPNIHRGGSHCHGSKCYPVRRVAWEWASTPFVNAKGCGDGCIYTSDIPLDIAVVRLKEDLTSAYGYLGFGYSCASKSYAVTTCGYPSDKPQYGSRMYCQSGSFSFAGCSGWGTGAVLYTSIDSAPGQSGSNLWTSDRMVRATLTGTGGGKTLLRAMNDVGYKFVLANRK